MDTLTNIHLQIYLWNTQILNASLWTPLSKEFLTNKNKWKIFKNKMTCKLHQMSTCYKQYKRFAASENSNTSESCPLRFWWSTGYVGELDLLGHRSDLLLQLLVPETHHLALESGRQQLLLPGLTQPVDVALRREAAEAVLHEGVRLPEHPEGRTGLEPCGCLPEAVHRLTVCLFSTEKVSRQTSRPSLS